MCVRGESVLQCWKKIRERDWENEGWPAGLFGGIGVMSLRALQCRNVGRGSVD